MGERNPVPAVCLKEVVFPRGWNLLRRRQPPPVLAVSRRGISFSLVSLPRWTKAPIKRSKATRVLSPSVWSITLLVRSRRSFDIGFSFPGTPLIERWLQFHNNFDSKYIMLIPNTLNINIILKEKQVEESFLNPQWLGVKNTAGRGWKTLRTSCTIGSDLVTAVGSNRLRVV